MRESKEKIKARMIKNASRVWGYSDTEAESSFDPLVSMILGALSQELDLISDDIHNSESRIVEKLIQLVTPEPVTGPFPAHAVLHADPVLPHFEIPSDYQFYTYKKFRSLTDSNKTEERSVFFSPTGAFRLVKGRVLYLAQGQRLFEFQEEGFKEVCADAFRGKELEPATFWLGLDLSDEIETLDGLRIFFDVRSEHQRSPFYQALLHGKWFINGIPVRPSAGFGNQPDRFRNDLDDFISQEVDITAKVTHHVNRYYRDQFITLDTGKADTEGFLAAADYPDTINQVFPVRELGRTPRKLFWIEIQQSHNFSSDIFDELHCSLNCFPVVNRQLNDFTFSSRENVNIIPLETDDTFLDVKSVTNSEGKSYTIKSFSSLKSIQKGSYILRQGGIARFDSRDAREMIHYLLELLRDESAAFTVLGTDMISSNLRELNQGIARLEQRLADSNIARENLTYLMLKAEPQDDMVFVEFWSTQASGANKIKAGTRLSVYEGSDIKGDSVFLMTPSQGGRDKLDTEERLNAYRRTLLSRGRVVTPEDVKALCYEHFGKSVDQIEVVRGVMKGDSPTLGFVRTIDVNITLSRRITPFTDEELRFLVDDLRIKLKEQSNQTLPFRIFVK
jgi:hypothetical protein